MRIMISGHRLHKLELYDVDYIKEAIEDILFEIAGYAHIRGLSGMASGVDLWFLDICEEMGIRYEAYIPFDGQDLTMDNDSAANRQHHITRADVKRFAKNREMVEACDMAIVVWDGNKGGTHNVVQQLVETKKDFVWINPVSRVIWKCFQKIDTF